MGNEKDAEFFSEQELYPYLSSYISDSFHKETWAIHHLSRDSNRFAAVASLCTTSPQKNFHLSIFSAREIVSQLRIASSMLLLGQSCKTAEVWFIEGSEKCTSPITSAENIRISLTNFLKKLTKNNNYILGWEAQMQGCTGGEFIFKTVVMIPANELRE